MKQGKISSTIKGAVLGALIGGLITYGVVYQFTVFEKFLDSSERLGHLEGMAEVADQLEDKVYQCQINMARIEGYIDAFEQSTILESSDSTKEGFDRLLTQITAIADDSP